MKKVSIKENPKYLTQDKVDDLQGKKLLAKIFDLNNLKRKITHAQKELALSHDDYIVYEDLAQFRAVDFGNDNSSLAREFNLISKPDDEFFFEELDEAGEKVIDLLLKNYPDIFTSPYGYQIHWDEGDFVLNVSLDEDGLNEILGEDMKKENPIKNSTEIKELEKHISKLKKRLEKASGEHARLIREEIKQAEEEISDIKKENPSYLKSKFVHFDTLKKLCKAGFEVYLKDNYRDQVDCKNEDQLRKAFLMPQTFFTSDLFRYTDYGGGYTVAKANIKYIEENYSDLIDQELISIYSTAYSGENCEFSLECLSNQNLVEELLGLNGYPLLSDDTLSEVEMELEDESWDSYGRDDFKKELEEAFGENVENLSDDEIDSLAFEASQYTSEGKGHVEAMQFYFDNDGMIEALKELNKKSKGKLMKKENPSIKLANPEWASDHDVWERAKKQSLKEYGRISYPFVVFLYKQMGGKVKKKK